MYSRSLRLISRTRSLILAVALAVPASTAVTSSAPAQAAHSPQPSAVTIAGSLQSELGCPGDWQPGCVNTQLTFDAADGVWQGTFTVPAGSYEYKAPLNNGWDENYGAGGAPNGANIALALAAESPVKFYYDHASHWVTSNKNAVIAVAPGNFQSELGCPGDWQPDCLRSWLKDLDGDGVYEFTTTEIPPGSYEGKVAINEAWDENYGAGGAPNGANIPFAVAAVGAKVTFRYVAATKSLTIQAGQAPDNNIAWDGLRHDSRDMLYRTPGGAVVAGSSVKLRFRTFHNDVTSVKLRLYDLNANGQRIVAMTPAATNVSCMQSGLEGDTCDFWETTLSSTLPNNYWYRFIVTDGSRTVYYADDSASLDGGLGRTSNEQIDQSYALMFYAPQAETSWMRGAVIYQIFPDRFRNGDTRNDPETGDVRYDDPVIALPWGTLPEGFCRHYADANTNCPWRYDTTPPAWSPAVEGPRGRDYYGGDLQGVMDKLDYLKALGVTVIYFNPIFDAKSNHRYDTASFENIDPALGSNSLFKKLSKEAKRRGIKIVLDGVFNHMSSDSPNFDRYNHYDDKNGRPIYRDEAPGNLIYEEDDGVVTDEGRAFISVKKPKLTRQGACESPSSRYRSWFVFRTPSGAEPAPCAPSEAGGTDTYYDGWFGFDSIPVINKANLGVQEYFIGPRNKKSITRRWLKDGAAGWRMDVMGDASFPDGYWEVFRRQVKAEEKDAIIIGELWQKDSTLLRYLRGDRADTAMNYRLRDAVIGFLTPQGFDSKGFGDSGRIISPSEFGNRVSAIREDYPDYAYFQLMNLLDSHDTERLLWTLTPGVETEAEKNANSAAGKQRVKLASLIQFTMPGAPTVYYGDEVGVTGDDDPDDRRTYPWTDLGGSPDNDLLAHYTALAAARKANTALVNGDFTMLLTDDAAGVIAYGRKTGGHANVIAVNRGSAPSTLQIPVALPEGTALASQFVVNTGAMNTSVAGGKIQIVLAPMSGVVLAASGDFAPTAAPTGLTVVAEGNGVVGLSWSALSDAVSYNVYRSAVSGGGWVKVNAAPVSATAFNDSGLVNARTYYYAVTAVDAAGNESAPSAEVAALPRLSIGWANTQWPPSIAHTISAVNRTANVYGQIYIDGETSKPGRTPSVTAQLGFGPDGSDPATATGWSWIDAQFQGDAGNNDEFVASLLPEAIGSFDYAYRYSTTNGREWTYADLDGISNGYAAANAGALTVTASTDTSPPAAPANLRTVNAGPASIAIAWDAVTDATLFGYDVWRSDGGAAVKLATVTTAEYTDASVAEGGVYTYTVRSVDTSFNRSDESNSVTAKAELRKVTVTFTLTVPSSTDGTGRAVHIAGFLDRLDGGLPQWNPGGVSLTRVDATTWRIVLTGNENTQIEYKYALGAWEYVEKDGTCGEIGNRQLTLSYGVDGQQAVNDAVANWRNVAPCGN